MEKGGGGAGEVVITEIQIKRKIYKKGNYAK